MPTGLEAKAVIDKKLKAKLAKHRNREGFAVYANELIGKGYEYVTRKMLSKIFNSNKPYDNYSTVPYDLYVEIVGKEPKEVIQWESIQLARGIARWYCYFFNVKKKELARQIAEDAKQQGLDYAVISIESSLFHDKRKSRINSTITAILANKFKNAAGMLQSSLDETREFVNYFDSIYHGEELPGRVDWGSVRPVIDDLQRLTGCGLVELVGKGIIRKRLESGGRKLSVEKYIELKIKREENLQYKELLPYRLRLVQALRYIEDVLQSTGSNNIRVKHIKYLPDILALNEEELQLLDEGWKNYGEEAFMKHIFPAYMAIKQEHVFPSEYFEIVVKHPEKIKDKYKVPLDILAEEIGNKLIYHKKILDHNKSIDPDFRVTEGGIKARLIEATTEVFHHKNTNIYSTIR